MLIDTHAHLGGTDVDERLAVEMLGLGMPDVIVAASYDVESSLRSARIAGENAKIFSMVGVHPNDSQKLTCSPVEQLRAIPQDRLLAETDSPYMTPEPHRGESNVPANVKYVVRKMAEILSMDEQRMTDITGENARRLFKLEF